VFSKSQKKKVGVEEAWLVFNNNNLFLFACGLTLRADRTCFAA
jgi:hypothetical protein